MEWVFPRKVGTFFVCVEVPELEWKEEGLVFAASSLHVDLWSEQNRRTFEGKEVAILD